MKVLRGLLAGIAGLLFMFSTSLSGQGYRIEITMEGLSGDTLILGEYFTSRMIPKDTMILDRKGKGVFEGEDAFQGGLYLIYFSPSHYFDLLLGNDQELFINADTSDLNGSIGFKGSEDNRIFYEYKNYLQEKRGELEKQQSLLANAATKADSSDIKEQQKRINGEMEEYMNRIESENASLFVSKFIGATREPLPPEALLTGERRHDDSVRYFYYRDHYFDRFDPFDVRLLHSPLYEGKIKSYLARVVPQHPDSLIVGVDYLLGGSRAEEELYRYLLITLFNHFAESKFMGMDVVYFHIAEHYYIPDATWSNPEFLSKLKDNLDKNKPSLIGQKSPNLIMRMVPPDHFQMASQDTTIKKDPHIGEDFFIHETDARYTILYFWEADCGHCKESTPALYEVHSRLKEKGVEVISIHVINTIEGKEKWVDFVNKHGLYDWINCWSPYSNDFRKLYNLQSYPQLFILDQDKKIVAKRITPEQAEQIINNLININP
ncbi:MAG: redoxin domain-containing protein [Bacteroidales bacterium]|nr:redoxin domain-containing protein [Bacteroidales bacterium]